MGGVRGWAEGGALHGCRTAAEWLLQVVGNVRPPGAPPPEPGVGHTAMHAMSSPAAAGVMLRAAGKPK